MKIGKYTNSDALPFHIGSGIFNRKACDAAFGDQCTTSSGSVHWDASDLDIAREVLGWSEYEDSGCPLSPDDLAWSPSYTRLCDEAGEGLTLDQRCDFMEQARDKYLCGEEWLGQESV